METWNRIKMGERFLRHANALHPEEARGERNYEEMLAEQDLAYECYMSSFSREKLIEALQKSILGDFKIPDEVDVNKYRVAYIQLAKTIFKEFEG